MFLLDIIRKTHFRSGCNLSKRCGAPGVDIDFRQRLNFGEGGRAECSMCYCLEQFNYLVVLLCGIHMQIGD